MIKVKLSKCCNYKVITIPSFPAFKGHPSNSEFHNCDKCEKECEIDWVDFEPYDVIFKGARKPKIDWAKEHGFDPIKFYKELNKSW